MSIVNIISLWYNIDMNEWYPDGLPDKCKSCPALQRSLVAWRLYNGAAYGSKQLLTVMAEVGISDEGTQNMNRVALESDYEATEIRNHIADFVLECAFDESLTDCPND
jgi:hypothetical protein